MVLESRGNRDIKNNELSAWAACEVKDVHLGMPVETCAAKDITGLGALDMSDLGIALIADLATLIMFCSLDFRRIVVIERE